MDPRFRGGDEGGGRGKPRVYSRARPYARGASDAGAGIQGAAECRGHEYWMPAYAGMTDRLAEALQYRRTESE